jgi:hypothetical protein
VIEFREGIAETIELQSSTFDALLCRWELIFLSNLKVSDLKIKIVMKETNSLPSPPGTPGPI